MKNKDGIEILKLDRDTHRLMKFDAFYYSEPIVTLEYIDGKLKKDEKDVKE